MEVAELFCYSEISIINGITINNPEITKRNGNSGQKPGNYKKKRKFRKFPSKFLHKHDVHHIHNVAYMNKRRLYYVRNLRTLTGISGVLTGISVSFQNFRYISVNSGNSGNFLLISVKNFG